MIGEKHDLVECPPKLWNPYQNKKIVHIDLVPSEVDAAYVTDVEVIGDISISLTMLAEMAIPKEEAMIADALRRLIIDQINAYQDDKGFPLKPQRILSDVRKVLNDDDILISDVGAHKMWIARMYLCSKPNTCIISNGFAAMGIAVPGAISAKLFFPDRKILAVTGDGGFLMNSQELETAVRLKTPFVTLIFHDKNFGSIRWKQVNRFGHPAYVDFDNPDFVKYAESFGAKGYRVLSPDELIFILQDAFAQEVPAVIDCSVDYRENQKLTEQLGNLTCPI